MPSYPPETVQLVMSLSQDTTLTWAEIGAAAGLTRVQAKSLGSWRNAPRRQNTLRYHNDGGFPRWAADREQELRDLFEEGGRSVGAIARILGITKNAAIGKLNRLGLIGCWKPPRESPSVLALRDLPNDGCMWPHGDPQVDGFHFCGAPKMEARSYCEAHVAIAFRRFLEEEEEAA